MKNPLITLVTLFSLSLQVSAQAQNKWDKVPMRSKVNIGDPYLIPIHPSDMNRASKQLALTYHSPSLRFLMFRAHVVAIGKFEGVLRYNYVPIGKKNPSQQSILYAFRVERYLKGEGYGPVLKVRQIGGPLSLFEGAGASSPTGVQISDDPLPVLGERYIVFLQDPRRELLYFAHSDYVSAKRDNPSEIYYYTDEFSFSDYLQGKILLKDGKTQPLIIDDKPLPWTFQTGPQLLGIGERLAISLILGEKAAEEARQAKYRTFPVGSDLTKPPL